MPKIITLALAAMLSLALAAPVHADRGHGGGGFHGGRGGGFHGGRGGGFHGSHGGFHGGGFRHGQRFHRGCCFGPVFVGGVFVGYPYYSYPYYGSSYPYYDSSYSYPAYSDPVYAPQTQLYAAPSVQQEVCYVGGCYRLQGDGVTTAYQWIWIPTVPNPPPPPPAGPPVESPPSIMQPGNSAPTGPIQQIYRWVDDEGVANWTNNRQAVPQRYRSQLQ